MKLPCVFGDSETRIARAAPPSSFVWTMAFAADLTTLHLANIPHPGLSSFQAVTRLLGRGGIGAAAPRPPLCSFIQRTTAVCLGSPSVRMHHHHTWRLKADVSPDIYTHYCTIPPRATPGLSLRPIGDGIHRHCLTLISEVPLYLYHDSPAGDRCVPYWACC